MGLTMGAVLDYELLITLAECLQETQLYAFVAHYL